MIEDTRLVLAMLALCVAIAELLARHTVLRHAGSSLVVIVVAAVLSNLGLIPTASTAARPVAAYDIVLGQVAPLAIFWLVLRVDLRRTLAAGAPLLLAFGVGAVGTVLGVLAGLAVVGSSAFGSSTAALGGMFAATYIGGSANFNALALHYDVVGRGALYAGTMAVDAGLTAVWMVVTIAIPRLARRTGRASVADAGPQSAAVDEGGNDRLARRDGTGDDVVLEDAERVDPFDLGLLVALGLFALWVTDVLVAVLAGWGVAVPGMLLLTALALGLAQLPIVARLRGTMVLGMFAVQVFLATIGALCDVQAVIALGGLGVQLLVLATVVIAVHGLLVFGGGRVLGYGPELAAIASQANIGGGTTALALARSIGRRDLVVPAILIGSVGTALGTFVGFAVAQGLG